MNSCNDLGKNFGLGVARIIDEWAYDTIDMIMIMHSFMYKKITEVLERTGGDLKIRKIEFEKVDWYQSYSPFTGISYDGDIYSEKNAGIYKLLHGDSGKKYMDYLSLESTYNKEKNPRIGYNYIPNNPGLWCNKLLGKLIKFGFIKKEYELARLIEGTEQLEYKDSKTREQIYTPMGLMFIQECEKYDYQFIDDVHLMIHDTLMYIINIVTSIRKKEMAYAGFCFLTERFMRDLARTYERVFWNKETRNKFFGRIKQDSKEKEKKNMIVWVQDDLDDEQDFMGWEEIKPTPSTLKKIEVPFVDVSKIDNGIIIPNLNLSRGIVLPPRIR